MEYQPLKTYLDIGKINEISKDFNAKLNFLIEKYMDKIVQIFIKNIQNADMRNLYKQETWRYKCEFMAQDIENIDSNKNYSNKIIEAFFKKLCDNLSVKLIDYQFSNTSEDNTRVFFIFSIENPIKMEF